MTTRCVDCALFTPNHKVIDISSWESHSSNRHRLGFVEHQLHALLAKQVKFFNLPCSKHMTVRGRLDR